MTRKDYELIAACVARSRMAIEATATAKAKPPAIAAVQLVAIDLAASLKAENHRFDITRFLAACGF